MQAFEEAVVASPPKGALDMESQPVEAIGQGLQGPVLALVVKGSVPRRNSKPFSLVVPVAAALEVNMIIVRRDLVFLVQLAKK